MRNASLEDCQLLAESEILQRDLFVAGKEQKDHPKKREDCVQHEAGSVSASSLKINRLRERWDLARHRPVRCHAFSRCWLSCCGPESDPDWQALPESSGNPRLDSLR